ncbi:MAG: glycosyltransferase family 4 protein [bacterium]
MAHNILFLSNFGSVRGGGEISLQLLLRGLDRARYAPTLALPEKGDLEEFAAAQGIPVRIAPIPPLKHPAAPLRVLNGVNSMIDIINESEISLIHSNTPARGALIAGLAARRAAIPAVWHVRIQDRDPILDRAIFDLYKIILTNSDSVGKKFARFPGASEKVRTAHNPVDLESFYPSDADPLVRASLGATPGDILVGGVGRMVTFKGHKYFIEAADRIARGFSGSNIRFAIIGDGPLLEDCKKQALASAAANRIVFTGHRDDIPAIMNALDLFVLPSIAEHFGRVVIEAMACRKPVIGTRAGGVPEIIEDGETGLLVPPSDSGSLAEAILSLASEPSRRQKIGAASRERAELLFSIPKHAEAVMAIYDEMLGGK